MAATGKHGIIVPFPIERARPPALPEKRSEPDRERAFAVALGRTLAGTTVMAIMAEAMDFAKGDWDEAMDLVSKELFGATWDDAHERWATMVAEGQKGGQG